MIHFQKGTTASVYFTATQHCLLTNPYFLFVFTSRLTSNVISLVATNNSDYTGRYDHTSVVVDTYFTDEKEGYWTYEVYEQASSSNTDITGLNKVEEGFMLLAPAVEFEPTEYEGQSQIFVTYGN